VRRCQDLPGQHLFQWQDSEGTPHPIGSADVNEYIRRHAGEGFSAKNFRTWSASLIAFRLLHEANCGAPIKEVLTAVAGTLGNTPAVSRKSYIHPEVLALAGSTGAALQPLPRATRWMSRHERGLIAFLDGCAAGSGGECAPVTSAAAHAEALLPA
jgi:DNA topoisomerase-1